MSGELFKKYYKRLAKEGFLKALLWGLTVGFSALAVFAALFWFMGWKAFWVCLLIWAGVSALASVAFYKLKFQPTTKAIARRVDELGLEERIITMTELEGDTSYIAMRQREDALKALGSVQAGLIKVVVSLSLIIATAISAFAGIGMVTVSALGATGVLPSGLELIQQSEGEEKVVVYKLVYEIKEGEGLIEGDLSQDVEKGCDGSPVIAVPDEEWVFIGWSDGLQNPYRQDFNVQSDLKIYAIFLPIDEALDGEEDAEKDETPKGEPNPNAPESEIKVPRPNASKKYEEINQVIDGNTYYGDVYADAAENTKEEISGGEYSEDQKNMASGYLDGIETTVNNEDENK